MDLILVICGQWSISFQLSLTNKNLSIILVGDYILFTIFYFNYLKATRSNIDCSRVAKFILGYLWTIIILSLCWGPNYIWAIHEWLDLILVIYKWSNLILAILGWLIEFHLGYIWATKFDLGYLNAIGYYLGLSWMIKLDPSS